MEFNLTAEQKIQSLESIESTMNIEIYNILLRCGVDPETFVEEDVDNILSPGLEGEVLRLKKLITAIALVRSKLQNI
jgi:hypothetical protein